MANNQTEIDNIIATLNAQGSPADIPQARTPIVSKRAPRQLRPERWTGGERTPTASETAFRLGVDGQRAGAGLLADPYASRFVYLDKPVHIRQEPSTLDLSQIDTHIAPSNSWAKIHLYEEGGAFYRTLVFYYLWRNESLNPVVISASAPLVMSGSCSATGSAGFFGGNLSEVSVGAQLAPQRWIGWGVDPGTGLHLDKTYVIAQEQSQWAPISFLTARGGWGFGSAVTASQTFDFQHYNPHLKSLMIPGGASIMFSVVVRFSGTTEGNSLTDQIWAAFDNHGVFSPYMLLTVRSPA